MERQDFHVYRDALAASGALVGSTDHGGTKALYAKDPDGLEFELTWIVPADQLGPEDKPRSTRLDLDAEIARFGAETLSGVGVSRPAVTTG